MNPWLITQLIFCFSLASCAHHSAQPSALKNASVNVFETQDTALLTPKDARLLAEAVAFDVTHGPWHVAHAATSDVLPQLIVGTIPDKVNPSQVPFPRSAFADSLMQSLRNTNKVTVLEVEQGTQPPIWRLDVEVQHDALSVQGEDSRGYSIDCTLRLLPSLTAAWSKRYGLRKRVRPIISVGSEGGPVAAPRHAP